MYVFKPYAVYENVIRMFDYRGIVLDGKKLNEDDFTKLINQRSYITFSGKKKADESRGIVACPVYVMVVGENSKYGMKNVEFRKLLKDGIPDAKIARANEGDKNIQIKDVIIVMDRQPSNHLRNELKAFRVNNPNSYVEIYDYSMFIIEKPKHVSMPKHEIATFEEIQAECSYYNKTKESFPKINSTDPGAVWIGLRPGMVAKIYRVSELAGEAVAFRLCKK